LEHRRRALRLLDRRQLEVPLLLGFLNAALDIADGFGVLVDLGLVARPERILEAGELRGDRVEDALVLAQPRLARRPIRAAAVAEQPLEHRARIPLHRERAAAR